MKRIGKKVTVLLSALVLLLVICPESNSTGPECPCLSSFYNQSLHSTGNGMRYWYEEPNGFMSITNIQTAHPRTVREIGQGCEVGPKGRIHLVDKKCDTLFGGAFSKLSVAVFPYK